MCVCECVIVCVRACEWFVWASVSYVPSVIDGEDSVYVSMFFVLWGVLGVVLCVE
jgi:hypothetical protein